MNRVVTALSAAALLSAGSASAAEPPPRVGFMSSPLSKKKAQEAGVAQAAKVTLPIKGCPGETLRPGTPPVPVGPCFSSMPRPASRRPSTVSTSPRSTFRPRKA